MIQIEAWQFALIALTCAFMGAVGGMAYLVLKHQALMSTPSYEWRDCPLSENHLAHSWNRTRPGTKTCWCEGKGPGAQYPSREAGTVHVEGEMDAVRLPGSISRRTR